MLILSLALPTSPQRQDGIGFVWAKHKRDTAQEKTQGPSQMHSLGETSGRQSFESYYLETVMSIKKVSIKKKA